MGALHVVAAGDQAAGAGVVARGSHRAEGISIAAGHNPVSRGCRHGMANVFGVQNSTHEISRVQTRCVTSFRARGSCPHRRQNEKELRADSASAKLVSCPSAAPKRNASPIFKNQGMFQRHAWYYGAILAASTVFTRPPPLGCPVTICPSKAHQRKICNTQPETTHHVTHIVCSCALDLTQPVSHCCSVSICFVSASPVDGVAHGPCGAHGGLKRAVGHRRVAIQVGQLAQLVGDVRTESLCGGARVHVSNTVEVGEEVGGQGKASRSVRHGRGWAGILCITTCRGGGGVFAMQSLLSNWELGSKR